MHTQASIERMKELQNQIRELEEEIETVRRCGVVFLGPNFKEFTKRCMNAGISGGKINQIFCDLLRRVVAFNDLFDHHLTPDVADVINELVEQLAFDILTSKAFLIGKEKIYGN